MGAFQSQPLNGRGNEEETTLAVTKVLLLVGVEIVQVLVTHFTDSKREELPMYLCTPPSSKTMAQRAFVGLRCAVPRERKVAMISSRIITFIRSAPSC
jgi:hypothetical protein